MTTLELFIYYFDLFLNKLLTNEIRMQTPHACQKVRIGADTQNSGTSQFQSNMKIQPVNAPKITHRIRINRHPIILTEVS
jgi:hypothetical protein